MGTKLMMTAFTVMSDIKPHPAKEELSKTGLFSLAGLGDTRHNDAFCLVF